MSSLDLVLILDFHNHLFPSNQRKISLHPGYKKTSGAERMIKVIGADVAIAMNQELNAYVYNNETQMWN